MKELAILRHGQSPFEGTSDYDRMLSPLGAECVRRNVVALRQGGFRPDLIVTSSARRALESAEVARQVYGLDPDLCRPRQDLYECDLRALLRAIMEDGGETEALMIVGHNPGLTVLASKIDERAEGLGTGEIHWLRMAIEDWALIESASAEAARRFRS